MSPKILSLQNNKGELVSPEVIWEIHYEGKKKRALIGWDLVTRQRVAATIGLVTSRLFGKGPMLVREEQRLDSTEERKPTPHGNFLRRLAFYDRTLPSKQVTQTVAGFDSKVLLSRSDLLLEEAQTEQLISGVSCHLVCFTIWTKMYIPPMIMISGPYQWRAKKGVLITYH